MGDNKIVCGCGWNRRAFLGGIAAISCFPSHRADAQTLWQGSLDGTCNFYPDSPIDGDVYTFRSNREAVGIVDDIVGAGGLRQNFEIMQANVPNAAAVIKDGKRYILYSQVFIDDITQSTATEWAAKTILAHEVGHHLNGHTLDGKGSQPPTELEADYYAGFVVGRLGGPRDGALAPFKQMSENGSPTHPPRAARLEAVAGGWREGSKGSVSDNRDPDVTPQPEKDPSDNPLPPPSTDATGILRDILTTIQQGSLPTQYQLSPPLHAELLRQHMWMVQGLQSRGNILQIIVQGSQALPNGGTYLAAAVQFRFGWMNWQLSIEPNGVISGLYGV
jgi:hypothetical protein